MQFITDKNIVSKKKISLSLIINKSIIVEVPKTKLLKRWNDNEAGCKIRR